ncbi:hypothetical protein O181_037704 [Austropuccinia psidii MF-1]|uniref:Uncharacterized protein n=1 Tax=Austropuccinia psidii MF-1 TaxID=1389203 RepID=A0A9Q3D6W4_9BASI|nr:hypothetical protein [Austropuccinia psidii MF-1]
MLGVGVSSRSHSATQEVLTSIDIISNLLSNFIPPQSNHLQAWLASLALVHPTWSQAAYLALRRHPIISSVSQLLSFQDSLWAQNLPDQPPNTLLPSRKRCAPMLVEEAVLRKLQSAKELYLEPGFFSSLPHLKSLHLSFTKLSINNFKFLLSNLARSLTELGLHNVYFVGAADSKVVFDVIFSVLHLTSLHLTGRLAGLDGIGIILSNPPPAFNSSNSLKTLCLSDAGVDSVSNFLDPFALVSCWQPNSNVPLNKLNPNHSAVSLPTGWIAYPHPVEILNYRVFTDRAQWHEPEARHALQAAARQFGIQVEIFGGVELMQRLNHS